MQQSRSFASKSVLSAATAVLALSASLIFTNVSYAFDDAQKAEIGQIVKDYLIENPEIIIEVQQALAVKQENLANAQKTEVLKASSDKIFGDPADPVFGNPDGDVTIVEFFDYNCGFCRRGVADMERILKNDPKVRFVLKEFPIFGPNSIAVHTVALAYHNIAPEKYLAYHIEMMKQDGQIDEARALAIAESQGADMDALRDEMNNPAIVASFRQTDQIASGLGITGTPSYVIGDEVVVGALGEKVLSQKMANVRACGSASC